MKKTCFFSILRKVLIILFLFSIFFCICAFGYVNKVSAHISESVLRLHVIANSNSDEDQNLKYLVRDKLIEYMNILSKDANSKNEAICIAREHLSEFEDISKKVIDENGFNYNVVIEIGKFEFPTKKYGDISLPSGSYDALEIKIGDAKGENWWCVMFPPLCFVDVTNGVVPEDSKKLIKEELSDEEFSIVAGNDTDIKFKFKLLELFSGMSNILTAKK